MLPLTYDDSIREGKHAVKSIILAWEEFLCSFAVDIQPALPCPEPGAWQRWLKSHSELAKELFPGKDYRLYGVLPFSYTVVIGQRKHSPEFIANRNDLSRETGIQIRSFDYLTDKLRERHFWVEMHIFSTEYKRLSDPTRNALANPFYTTFSSSEWRDLIRQDLDITHMTPNNATLILQNRKLNKYDRMFRRLVAGDLGEKTNTEVRELINEFG